MKLTQKRLKECLEYNPITGDFTWLIDTGKRKKAGDIVRYINTRGYYRVGIDYNTYQLHCLAFLYMTGEVPRICDHINRIRTDNRWCNLRAATDSENMQNRSMPKHNKTGYKGVSHSKTLGKFIAQITVNKRTIHIGSFSCKHQAFCEYVLMSRKHFCAFSTV